MKENPRPVLLEFKPSECARRGEWNKICSAGINGYVGWKDPVKISEILSENNVLTTEFDEALRLEIKKEMTKVCSSQCWTWNRSSLTEELNDVYKPFVFEEVKPQQKKNIRFIDAISTSLRQSMERQNSVIMGQDIAEYGGAFKITMDL
jgi:2-oxoisovalerate dehydrogenase E1 component